MNLTGDNSRYRVRNYRALGDVSSTERGPVIHNTPLNGIIRGSLREVDTDMDWRWEGQDTANRDNETNDNTYNDGSLGW